MTEGGRPRRLMLVQRPAGGGSMTALLDLVRSLDRDRYDPVVLTYQAETGYETELRNLGATLFSLNHPRGPGTRTKADGAAPGHETARPRHGLRQARRLIRSDLPIGRAIAQVIRREGIDLVHHNDNPRGDRGSILGAWMARVPQTSHVRYTPTYYKPIDRRLARSVRRYLTMSEAIRQHMSSNLGSLPAPVEVVYDPFHFDVHDRALRANAPSRSEWGFGPTDFVLASVGRIVPWKGQDVFLRALRKTVDAVPDAKALIVGGPKETTASQDFWHRLQALTDELDLRSAVVFTGLRRDVPQVMAASDVVVHTATMAEPFGKVLVEAMATRRPVVATAFGGPLEIVDEGDTGRLVPASDPEALASVLIDLARNPERGRLMGERGRVRAEQRFGVEPYRAAMERIFDEAVQWHPRGRRGRRRRGRGPEIELGRPT